MSSGGGGGSSILVGPDRCAWLDVAGVDRCDGGSVFLSYRVCESIGTSVHVTTAVVSVSRDGDADMSGAVANDGIGYVRPFRREVGVGGVIGGYDGVVCDHSWTGGRVDGMRCVFEGPGWYGSSAPFSCADFDVFSIFDGQGQFILQQPDGQAWVAWFVTEIYRSEHQASGTAALQNASWHQHHAVSALKVDCITGRSLHKSRRR